MLSQEKLRRNLGTLVAEEPGLDPPQPLDVQRELEYLRSQVRELAAVAEVHKAIAPAPTLEQLLAHIFDKLNALLQVEKAGVFLHDHERNELVLTRPAFGFYDDELIGQCRIPLDEGGNSVEVFLTRLPHVSNDCFSDPRIIQRLVRLCDARSAITVPLCVEDRCIGVLHACNKRGGPFVNEDLQLLLLLADHLAALIENARSHERERQRVSDLEKIILVMRDQHDKLQQAVAIHERLTHAALQDTGVDGIARALASLVDNPVVVEDRFFHVVSSAPHSPVGQSSKAASLEIKETPPALLEDRHFCEQIKLLSRGKHPVQFPAYPQFGRPWSQLTAIASAGKTTFGYVSILAKNRPFCELDIVAVEHAATVLALEMQKQKAAFEAEQRLKGDVLDDLLTGNFVDDQAMLRRAAFLDYDLSSPHIPMVVDIDGFGAYLGSSGSDERVAIRIKKKLFDIVHGVVLELSPRSMAVSKSDSVIVLLGERGHAIGTGQAVKPEEVAEEIRRRVKQYLPHHTVSIAVGRKCVRPRDCKRSYQVARKSLDILKAFGERDRVLSFDRLGAHQLLLQIEDKSELKEFVDRMIGPLVAYDKKHNSSLVQTLESFLQNDCNLKRTSRATFVHFNTLKYRLERVEEIAGIDLGDPETRLDLHLALKVWRMVGRD